VIYGVNSDLNEWRRKTIRDNCETVEVKIEELNCAQGIMTFHFKSFAFQKQIDARTCIVFNVGQKIKLKHSEQYPDTFLFVNERRPGQFILGGLEIALGIIGLLANWPMRQPKRIAHKDFPRLSDN
jgi:hypothetical protein